MTDPLTPIINQLANLVSFKSALRLLLIAFGIIICWIHLQSYLENFKLPNELSITLVTIIGFSFGALISAILFTTFDYIKKMAYYFYNKKQEKKEHLKKMALITNQKAERISIFKQSFEEYSHEAKNILFQLTIKDKALKITDWQDSETNITFKGLHENKIIIILEKIDKKTFFCTINPLYKAFLNDYFKEQHKKHLHDVMSRELASFNILLVFFKNTEKDENHVFKIGIDVYSERYSHTPVILHEDCEIGDYEEECNTVYSIPDQYHELLSKIMGVELRYYILANVDELRPVTDVEQ